MLAERTRRKKVPVTFEGRCEACGGSGLWQQRSGYECRQCGGTGQMTIGLVRGSQFEGRYYYKLRPLSRKTGAPLKQTYYAEARLTKELERWAAGATVGGGFYQHHLQTEPVGHPCSVYSVTREGELGLALSGGGVTRTGRHEAYKERPAYEIAVEVTEEAAAAAIELVREIQREEES